MPYCKICFKKIRRVNWSNLFFKTPICNDCRKKLTPKFFEFQLEGVKGTAIFDYDETIRSLLFQFKGQYDIELANIFLEYYASYFHLRFRDFIIVPAPSSKESDEKREFNHVEEMFKVLKLPIIKIFYKKENYKQSDLNSLERKKVEEKIGLTENFDISRNFRKETETYTIKTNIKSVLINGIPLMNILFSESNIDKKNALINLISASACYFRYYNEYPDTTITFDLIIYENGIEIYSNILGSLFNLKDNSDLKIILDKVK